MKPARIISQDFLSKTDQEIRDESKSWGPEEWEAYLQTLEVGLKESQPSSQEVSRLGMAPNIFELVGSSWTEELSELVEKLISELTERQRLVIKKYFFEGLSERQIARKMLISRSGVVELKKRALRQLKNKARKALSNFPKGESRNSKNQNVLQLKGNGGKKC